MKKTRWVATLVWPLAASAALAQGGPAIPPNAAYLAANCANCHGTTGNAKGAMPSLAGQPKAFIVEQMKSLPRWQADGDHHASARQGLYGPADRGDRGPFCAAIRGTLRGNG